MEDASTSKVADSWNLDINAKLDAANIEAMALGSDWKSPVKNSTNGIPRNVRCGSEAHNNNTGGTYSKHAADIGVGNLTSVYAAMGGTVTFSGWANNGYGNLITVQATDGKLAYYAHLSHFFPMAGSQTYTLTLIALSGNSSTTQPMAYHLHFHVRNGNNSVDLTGMSGFTNYGNYPGTPGVYANCGSMGR